MGFKSIFDELKTRIYRCEIDVGKECRSKIYDILMTRMFTQEVGDATCR